MGLSKLLGHVKFSVPLVDWTHQALENLRVLCEELASEGSDDVSIVQSVIVLIKCLVVCMVVLDCEVPFIWKAVMDLNMCSE